MSKSHKGVFEPTNPHKYKGNRSPTWRSSWELKVMRELDEHPSVLEWDSEPLKIPYYNPVKKEHSVYIPDFVAVMATVSGGKKTVMIEVKPLKESVMESAKSKRDKINVIINAAKWDAAQTFCEKYNMTFKVITEHNIFSNMKR